MPGPAHSGTVYVQHWAPGIGTAGATQNLQLGGFATDMILSRICRDPGASYSGSAAVVAGLQIQQAVGLHLYDVFRNLRTDSDLFKLDDAQPELGILVAAGSKVRFEVSHLAGGTEIEWSFYWVSP